MNVLDIALIVGALGIAALTFTQPPITVVADIAALYAASVLAGLFYVPVSNQPFMRFLPQSNSATARLIVFVVLLVGGALLLRGLLRRIVGMMAVSRRGGGQLLGNLISAALSVLLAVAVALVAVVALAAIAQMPSTVGVVAFAREQTAHSQLLARLARPMAVYLGLVNLWFPTGLPGIYTDAAHLTGIVW